MDFGAVGCRQVQRVRRRIDGRGDIPHQQCTAFDCSRPTQRSSGTGLSEAYCKQHIEFRRRHGSTWRRSYKVSEILPYRKAAKRWLGEHRADPMTARVISALDAMIARSGPAKSAHDLRWLSPQDRADQVISRLREAGIPGKRLLEFTLTIKAAMADIGPRANPEFMQVQIAKMAHRLNSGTTRTPSGLPMRPKYPRPEGRFMRVLGHMIEDLAGIAATPEAVREVVSMANSFKRDIASEPVAGMGPAKSRSQK